MAGWAGRRTFTAPRTGESPGPGLHCRERLPDLSNEHSLRIALDTTFAGRNPTGVGVYSRQIFAALKGLATNNTSHLIPHTSYLVRAFGSAAYPAPAHWRDLALENPLTTQIALPLALLAWRPDIVHSTA